MKKRVILIVKGVVQKVGYREVVKKIADSFGATGYVENMRNSNVKIVCEIEQNMLDKFINALKIKKDFINVEDIEVVEETEATGEFDFFDIRYGRLEEELGDRAEAMILYLGGIQGSVNKVSEDVKDVGKEVRGVS
ncbi:MAG: acylphosphatase, partial [Candidatus Thermoplasmatota archaeon]